MIFRKRDWQDEYDPEYARERPARRLRPRLSIGLYVLIWAVLVGIFLVAVRAVAGQAMLEQVLTQLATPCGLVWFVLSTALYFSLLLGYGWTSLVCLVCWTILTVFGNGWVSQTLAAQLERSWLEQVVQEVVAAEDGRTLPVFDTIFVLGGSTITVADEVWEVNGGGDRVIKAVQMYHAGRVQRIVCTGSDVLRYVDFDEHPASEARRLLISLGVPAERIQEIGGTNTQTEIAAIQQFIEEAAARKNLSGDESSGEQAVRFGVVTSAWHMNRTMRLAQQQGLELRPVPCDFRSSPRVPSANWIVPSGDALALSRAVIKEWLAGWVGR